MQIIHPKSCLASSSNNIIFKGINLICTLLFAIIIILLLTSKAENYTSPWMFAVALAIAVASAKYLSGMREYPSKKWMLFLSLYGSVFQILVVQSYLFETTWDVWTLLRAAESTAYGTEWIPWFDEYFSTYPNNCLITKLYAIFFSISPVEPHILIIVCVNCLLSGFASYLTYRTVCIAKNDASGITAWCLYWVIMGMSPWISITYSDPLVIILPILSFYLYFYDKKIIHANDTSSVSYSVKHIICMGCIFFVSGIGYHIKPQTLIPAIAIFICLFFQNIYLRNYRLLIIDCMVSLLCLGLSVVFCNIVSVIPMLALNEEASLSPFHWIMMGLNPETLGRYSEEDVIFSKSFLTYADRVNGNIGVIMQRLFDFGLVGYLQLLKEKLTICMGDGTFYWAKNAANFFANPISNGGPLNKITTAFYYSDGNYYSVFCTISNVLWVFLLVSIFAGQILYLIKKQTSSEYTVIYLTLLGLIAFELIFEVFPRHLYSFVPIFILAAENGISGLHDALFSKGQHKK